jgi:hypothetical protein
MDSSSFALCVAENWSVAGFDEADIGQRVAEAECSNMQSGGTLDIRHDHNP